VNPDTDLDPIRIQGFDEQKSKKKKYSRKFFLFFFLSKIAIYLSLGLHKGRPSYSRRSLPPSKEKHSALQKNKCIHFLYFFVGHFCPPGTGSGLRIQIRIRIQGPH
jgi:hypothetical protein